MSVYASWGPRGPCHGAWRHGSCIFSSEDIAYLTRERKELFANKFYAGSCTTNYLNNLRLINKYTPILIVLIIYILTDFTKIINRKWHELLHNFADKFPIAFDCLEAWIKWKEQCKPPLNINFYKSLKISSILWLLIIITLSHYFYHHRTCSGVHCSENLYSWSNAVLQITTKDIYLITYNIVVNISMFKLKNHDIIIKFYRLLYVHSYFCIKFIFLYPHYNLWIVLISINKFIYL